MYVTMMDPFQIKYGNLLSGALVLPSLLMDILWVATTLLGLGDRRSCLTRLLDQDADLCFLSLRGYHQRDPGPALRLLRLGLVGRGHRLHAAGGAVLGGLHRRHPAGPHLLQPGESAPSCVSPPRRPTVTSRPSPVAVRPFPAAQPRLRQHRGDGVQRHLPGALVGNAGPGQRLEMGGRLPAACELSFC